MQQRNVVALPGVVDVVRYEAEELLVRAQASFHHVGCLLYTSDSADD
jgi:hypothetical protein